MEGFLSSSNIGRLRRQLTIGALPDDILLEIFDFYAEGLEEDFEYDWWHTLAHVCRRWRNVVFVSPRRLDLQLLCTPGRSVREMLDTWPELPIVIEHDRDQDDRDRTVGETDNVVDALKLNDRVSVIRLWNVSSSELEAFVAAMQDPFTTLINLELWSHDRLVPVISDSFLGGSAPRLQSISLNGIPFPTLPNLLLDIPHSGYISPEAMVTCLSALSRLNLLSLRFQSPRSRPDRARLPPPLTRTILPALKEIYFQGVTEYLEDLVARIHVPLLENIGITFFNQLIFNILQLPRFLFRTEKFKRLDQAEVAFYARSVDIILSSQSRTVDPARLNLGVSCRALDWQLSSLAQVCNLCLSTLPTLERLDIRESRALPPDWQDDIESTQWLELLQPFATVKNLYLSEKVVRHVAPALQELAGERVTEVLPALQALFHDELQNPGPVQDKVQVAFREFLAARELSGHPVATHHWEGGRNESEDGSGDESGDESMNIR